jgi:hypothetical protein
MWGRSAAVGAIVAAVLVVPATSASAVRHLREFNSPDRTIFCFLEGCEATLTGPLTNPSSQYTAFFTSTGKLQTCAAAPPFSVSHPGCIMHFFGAPVLAFGETNEIEGVRCASAPDGVTCTKVAGAGAGKGFRINAHEVVRVGSASSGSSPAPTFNRTAVVRTVSGTVLVKTPGSMSFTPLGAVTSVPMGTTIDTTNGTVALTTASDSAGHTQSGQFYSGIFRLTQTRAVSRVRSGRRVGLTVLTLAGGVPSGCGAATATRAHRATSPSARRLWGNAHGNFRTSGRYASATVRGTQWLTEDTCQGTLVKVARGVVAVEELRTHRTTLVRAGHSFLSSSTAAHSRGQQTIYLFAFPFELINQRNPLVIEPSEFPFAEDGAWLLEGLRWTGWDSRIARATGISKVRVEVGEYIKMPAALALSSPGLFKGHDVYRCFTVTVPAEPSHNEHRCIKRLGSSYGFG